MATTSITVRTRWEGAHRLPQLAGKCQQLHGHSWQAWITLTGTPSKDGTLIDFGVVRSAADHFIDAEFDHGILLGEADPLLPLLVEHDQKVYVFGRDTYTDGLAWPTVENVAECLARMATDALAHYPDAGDITVHRVLVAETENNQAVVRP